MAKKQSALDKLLGRNKPEPLEYKPKQEEAEVEEFMEIGGSPVPGITLRHVLRGHIGTIFRIAWSPDGRYLASPSEDKTVRIWEIDSGKCVRVLDGEDRVWSTEWSLDGRYLAVGYEKKFCLVNTNTWETDFEHIGEGMVSSIRWSPDGKLLAFTAGNKIYLMNTTNQIVKQIQEKDTIYSISWSPDGNYLASISYDDPIHIWKQSFVVEKEFSEKHNHGEVYTILWLSSGDQLITAGYDQTIRLWDRKSAKQLQIIEGHTGPIVSISLSSDGLFLASKASDGIRLWRTDTWENIALLYEADSGSWPPRLAFHPLHPCFASFGEKDEVIRIWDVEYNVLISNIQATESIHYTTAKLVLVGDSGVGKTGLGWRLAHNEFKEHSSTHGQQFWVVPELKKIRDDGTECEAVLWDLAGQPDYRLVHSLYLDDVDTALVLFDPTNRQEPLSGVDFWLNQLKDKDKKLRNSILVGARTDRGTSTLTNDELQAYCERNRISGGYIPTSALMGDGLPELMERIKAQIPWDEMTTTVTTITFKKIKEFVLALKEKTDRQNVLVKPEELRSQLQETAKDWEFSDAEMMTAVGHLENHGYVKVIHSSNGEESVLLAPDVLANLASSIVLEARRNPRGLGVLEEDRLLRGEYPFQELNNLSENEQKILLDAAAVLFLQRNVCFRETFNQQTFLVFPSLINEKRPTDESIKTEEGVSYRVKGAVENIYASLVVLLGYTNTFIRINQWQNQAQYELGEGEVCGFQQSGYVDGGIELVLNYGIKTPEPVRLMFRGLFERFLSRRELDISRYQPVKCAKCGSLLARNVVLDQLSKGKAVSFCHECGEKVSLPNPEPLTRLSPKEEVELDTQQAIAQYRTAFEAALVRVKGLLRDKGDEKKPTCFISYAWGPSEHQRWVVQLATDLRNAGIDILLDHWNVRPGDNISRFTERIMTTDYVVVVGTPGLLSKYNSTSSDPVVTAELEMLNLRLSQPNKYGHTILPILVEGNSDSSFSPQLKKLVYIDFKQTDQYFRQLFDMIWRLYDLPFDNPLLDELRASMAPQKR